MNQNADIGKKIKQLRTEKKMTLKQLSESAGLSIGFLSQLERGMTTIAIDSLAKVADTLEVELSSFFVLDGEKKPNNVVRNYEHEAVCISSEIIQYTLSKNPEEFVLLPRLYTLMPFFEANEDVLAYHHEGEEFIYVIEGILTVSVDKKVYDLYPGDCIQVHSEMEHNWSNKTNRVTKFIAINTPNPLKKDS